MYGIFLYIIFFCVPIDIRLFPLYVRLFHHIFYDLQVTSLVRETDLG